VQQRQRSLAQLHPGRAEQRPRLIEGEPQVGRADLRQLTFQPQPVQPQPQVMPGGQHEPQPRWTGTHAARPARPASAIHDRSRSVFPLPAGADTSVTRPAVPSRPEQRVAGHHPANGRADGSGRGPGPDGRFHGAPLTGLECSL
jgi:hypothetical protein